MKIDTPLLRKAFDFINEESYDWTKYPKDSVIDEKKLFDDLLPILKQEEDKAVEKAKEEERERIVGILEDFKNLKIDNITWDYASKGDMKRCSIEVDTINEAITRITN